MAEKWSPRPRRTWRSRLTWRMRSRVLKYHSTVWDEFVGNTIAMEFAASLQQGCREAVALIEVVGGFVGSFSLERSMLRPRGSRLPRGHAWWLRLATPSEESLVESFVMADEKQIAQRWSRFAECLLAGTASRDATFASLLWQATAQCELSASSTGMDG